MDNNEQLSVDIKYINQVLANRLNQAQSEIINLEALVTQLLEEREGEKLYDTSPSELRQEEDK